MAKKGKTVRRQSVPVAADVSILEEGWVLGATCLTCRTHYNGWEPYWQEEGAKLGEYDVTAQLPHTSKDYPICPTCLPWHWKAEASRWGMKKEVERVYG
jgi:hypothetical protein